VKNRIFKGIILLLILLHAELAHSEGSLGTSGADFLEIGTGSRAMAMAEAFTAEINDINSLYYNPAGLGTLRYPVLSIFHQELILDSRFENISAAVRLYDGWIAASNSLFWVPSFDRIDIDGNTTGRVQFFNGCFTIGYGYDFNNFYAGGSIKYIYQKIDTLFLNSAAVDLGILKSMYLFSPFDSPVRNFNVGISLLNLGTGVDGDSLPRMVRIGTSYKLTHFFGFNIDLTENFIDISDLYDFTYGFDESFRINMGIELNYLEIMFLRGGWRFNDAGTYSAGFGFNYSIGDVAFVIDTSYSDNGDFGPVYSFNITFKLIPKIITVRDKFNAEKEYKDGIKYFISDDIDTALEKFNKAKDYNPYHKNIDRKIEDLEKIKQLRKENRDLENELNKDQYRGEFLY
jgi:hypothetical protein